MAADDISETKAQLSNGAKRDVPRPGTSGSMKGEIWIASDFDTLPDDMAEAFGMSTASPHGEAKS